MKTLRILAGLGLPALALAAAVAARPEPVATPAADANLSNIKLPAGFRISYFAQNVGGARELALGPDGTVYVGSKEQGKVYALPDRNHDGRADEVITLTSGLNSPNGVAVRQGSLYVAEINRILRYDNIAANLKKTPKPVVVYNQLPTEEGHGWRYIAFGPDGLLYVPVGAPCNTCLPSKPIFGTINRLRPDGKGSLQNVARGVRNTVGFDWHPVTRELWFTDNGRDQMGDDVPDPEFGKGKSAASYQAPARKLGAHVAALGMKFYTGKQFPAKYHNQIFIPEHGSWNRSSKSGYRITLVRLDAAGKQAQSYETFAEGWLVGQQSWGRPVCLLVLPDGSMLVSDDQGDAVFRIWYAG
jgi:glucose/arabinose dehydrogenase